VQRITSWLALKQQQLVPTHLQQEPLEPTHLQQEQMPLERAQEQQQVRERQQALLLFYRKQPRQRQR
jgi:hypothetical protein